MARQLMFITGLSARELVKLVRLAGVTAARYASAGRTHSNCADIAEAVMGRDAWEAYKNSNYKSMKGPRAPKGSGATKKRVRIRNQKIGGSMAKWTLQHAPEPFAGEDTRWTMDERFTWLPPDGDLHAPHIETLGDMISEAFHNHKTAEYDKKLNDAKRAAKMTSTAAEVSQWDGATSVH